jgi:recombinational DNA repair protein RecT
VSNKWERRHTWVWQISYIEDSLEHVLPFPLLAQVQTRYKTILQLTVRSGFAGQLQISGVGVQNLIFCVREGGVDGG